MGKEFKEFGFERGWSQLKLKDYKTVKRKIMHALNLNNELSFRQRRSGVIEPKISEAKAIEEIFAEYGITDIWGSDEYANNADKA